MSFCNECTVTEVAGPFDIVAEIGEQLSWLGAALRSSHTKNSIAYCTPSISVRPNDGVSSETAEYRITFSVEDIDETELGNGGTCWRGLFRNPVIVRGFPIRSRVDENAGADIPLNIMAGLSEATHATVFNEKIFIKGFSTMFVATKLSSKGNTVSWHCLWNEDGSRIPYTAEALSSIECVSPKLLDHSSLLRMTHVVGWCSNAKKSAGSDHSIKQMSYN